MRLKTVGLLAVALTVAAAATAAAATPSTTVARHPSNVVDACGQAARGHARCFAEIRTDVQGGPAGVRGVHGAGSPAAGAGAAALPPGLAPSDLHAAYALPFTGGAGQTVAIVDAGDDATAEADLAVYRATYDLPPCTSANGCFRKLNQSGAASPLPPDAGWSVEIALDLDMVSATCPDCRIVLVEAADTAVRSLAAAVDTAVAAGATEVSNSYGATERSSAATYAPHYTHPGAAIVAASGDDGYQPANIPAAYQSVVAAGGTTLTKAPNSRGWTETAWSGAGSGCSTRIAKPSWQTDAGCRARMTADLAAVADPETGAAVYVTDGGTPQWMVVGGTSASAPIIAAIIALAGHPDRFPNAAYFYAHAAALHDVTEGNNSISGLDCGGGYQCNAGPGYDGPTGLGTPNGLGAF